MAKVLLLRSGGAAVADVDTIVTHEIEPQADGIAEARAFDAAQAWLVITSKTAVDVLVEAGAGDIFKKKWVLRVAAGAETGKAVKEAGAPGCLVPPVPGLGGIIQAVSTLPVRDRRILWPRGNDADPGPFNDLLKRGAKVSAPFVYVKKPVTPDPQLLEALRRGEYGAVAVGSLAALDTVMETLGVSGPDKLPPMTWGVLGPETAKRMVESGFPEPKVPEIPKISELVKLLQES